MRLIRIVLAVSAAAVVTAACGGESTPAASGSPSASASSSATSGDTASLDAAAILTKAQAALKAADSVRLKGGGSSEGATFQVDMRYASGGKAIGTVTANKRTVELRRIGDVIYLKADAAFWQASAGATVAKLLGGKYLKAPATDQRVASLAAFTDKDAFTKEVLDPDAKVTKGETKTVNGRPAIGLVSKGTSGGGTLYVASTGDPVPLQLVPEAGGADSGQLDFLEYGETVDVPVPPAAETIDASQLGN